MCWYKYFGFFELLLLFVLSFKFLLLSKCQVVIFVALRANSTHVYEAGTLLQRENETKRNETNIFLYDGNIYKSDEDVPESGRGELFEFGWRGRRRYRCINIHPHDGREVYNHV